MPEGFDVSKSLILNLMQNWQLLLPDSGFDLIIYECTGKISDWVFDGMLAVDGSVATRVCPQFGAVSG
jgi:hypothetical protein